jgi:hypothetical protein
MPRMHARPPHDLWVKGDSIKHMLLPMVREP